MRWVWHGYELNLSSWPQPSYTKNNKSALQEPDFIWNELRRVCLLVIMTEVEEKPHVVNALR